MYEPAINKATDKQLLGFKRTFLKDADYYAVNINGTDDFKELHSKRSELRKMAHSMLDLGVKENRSMTSSEKDSFDICTNLLSDIQVAFDNRQMRSIVSDKLNASNGFSNSNRCLETWSDAATGKAIPVLGKEHRFAEHINRSGNEVSAKDYFANLCGQQTSNEYRASMSTSDGSKGGFLVPETISGTIIDLLRAKNQIINAGALTIPLPAQVTRVCKVTSDPTASWVPENSLIPEDSSMSIGAIEFVAHKLSCLVKVSRELLQDAGNAASVIQDCIAKAMAQALDEACLYGNGVGQPQGICLNPDINTYSIGVNGNTLSGFDDVLTGLSKIVSANAPIPDVAIMHPRTLVNYSMLKDGDGLYLARPDLIANMKFLDTTKVPINEVQGTSSNCSSIIMGSFNQLVIGIRSQLEMLVLHERYAEFGQIAFLVTMRADTAVYQPNAFCNITGVLPL